MSLRECFFAKRRNKAAIPAKKNPYISTAIRWYGDKKHAREADIIQSPVPRAPFVSIEIISINILIKRLTPREKKEECSERQQNL